MLSSADDLMSEKDWVSVHDPTSGRVYYSNTKTNETRWTLPSSVMYVKLNDIVVSLCLWRVSREQGPWKKYNDPRTGRDYYYNINTKETRWELTLHAKTISDCISSCESEYADQSCRFRSVHMDVLFLNANIDYSLEAPYLPEDLRKEIHLFRDRAHTKHYFSKKTSGDRTSELFSTDVYSCSYIKRRLLTNLQAKDKRKLRRLSANSLQHFVRERLSSKGQPAYVADAWVTVFSFFTRNVSLASLHSTSSISERAEQTILDEYLLLEDLRKSSEVSR